MVGVVELGARLWIALIEKVKDFDSTILEGRGHAQGGLGRSTLRASPGVLPALIWPRHGQAL